jgi:hypothetical protein
MYLYTLAPQISETNCIVIVVGAAGAIVAVFVSFVALGSPTPHVEVYATFTVSPAEAKLLLVYLIRIILPVIVPESKLPVAPTEPIGGIVHKYPIGAGAVAVAAGNTGAVYLYILTLHTFV